MDSITSDLGGVLLGGIAGIITGLLGSGTTPSLSNQATGVSIGQNSITITPKTTGYITSYTVTNAGVI